MLSEVSQIYAASNDEYVTRYSLHHEIDSKPTGKGPKFKHRCIVDWGNSVSVSCRWVGSNYEAQDRAHSGGQSGHWKSDLARFGFCWFPSMKEALNWLEEGGAE